jgi:NAD(P)-dependent dehydrogenase (short-subunit alcohol dehydrogenase family)
LKRVLDVNLTGVFLCAQEAACEMIRAKSGVILNIASAFAVVAAPNPAAYCATKAAVAMLTKVLAIEWARDGLRVNAMYFRYNARSGTDIILTPSVSPMQGKGVQ